LNLLVVVHELGHFVVARLCGMDVRRFSIGFGPPVLTIEHKDTIYQLAAFPVGGFVQVVGLGTDDDHRAGDRIGDHPPGSYLSRPLWQRALMVSAGPAANFAFAAVLYVALFGSHNAVMYEATRLGTPAVKRVSGAAADAGLRAGDVIVAVSGESVVNHLQIQKATKDGQRSTLTVARAPEGVAIPWTRIPAGDTWRSMILMREEKGRGLVVSWPDPPDSWSRHDIDVVPRRDEKGRLRLGLSFEPARFGAEGAAANARYALRESYWASALVVAHFWKALVGKEKLQLASIVKVTEKGADSVEMGYEFFLTLLALISVNLGVINLLPFPALDGGRLIFVGIEGVARKPVPPRVELIMHAIGFLLLMSLMAVVVAKEIAEKF